MQKKRTHVESAYYHVALGMWFFIHRLVSQDLRRGKGTPMQRPNWKEIACEKVHPLFGKSYFRNEWRDVSTGRRVVGTGSTPDDARKDALRKI